MPPTTAALGTGRGLPVSEGDYRRLVHASPSPLVVVDQGDYRIVAANPAAWRALGYSEAELLAGSLADFASDGDREALRHGPGASLLPGLLKTRSSLDLLRRDGSPVHLQVVRAGVEFAHRPCALLVQAAEAEPSALDIRLGGASMTEFAFSALHDLKEPLHLVKGYLALLRQHGAGKLDAEGQDYLSNAEAGATRMQDLVLGLLEYFRADAKPVALEPVALQEVLDESLVGLRLQVQDAGATVTHEPLPEVMADRGQLARVLQNLLSNALKFRGDRPPAIQVEAMPIDGAWEVVVRDNGIGIAEGERERVLQPFQRLHSTDQYPGTGLGLSICRKVVEAHGGRLWIDASPGGGTEVHFTLPRRAM